MIRTSDTIRRRFDLFCNYFNSSDRSVGGVEAEQALRVKITEEEHNTILDSVNALMKLRRTSDVQKTPSTPKDGGDFDDKIDGRNSADNIIVSRDYYDQCGTSDESTDESTAEESPSDPEELNNNNCKGDGPERLNDLPRNYGIAKVECDKKTNAKVGEKKPYVNGELADVSENKVEISEASFQELPSSAGSTEEVSGSRNALISENNESVEDESNSEKRVEAKVISNNNEETDNEENNAIISDRHRDGGGLADITRRIGDLPCDCDPKQSKTWGASCLKTEVPIAPRRDEQISKVLIGKGLQTLEILPISDDETELDLSNSNKIEESAIELPWKQPCSKLECHIKKCFE